LISRREIVGIAIWTILSDLWGLGRLLGVCVDLKALTVLRLMHLCLVWSRTVEDHQQQDEENLKVPTAEP
jgi:hypothetical protein